MGFTNQREMMQIVTTQRIRMITFLFLLLCVRLNSQEFYITPDGETIYYESPRVLYAATPKPEEKRYTVYLSHGKRNDKTLNPGGIWVDRRDRVFISEKDRGVIRIFDAKGRFRREAGPEENDKMKKFAPADFALTLYGDIITYNRTRNNLAVLGSHGHYRGVLDIPKENKETMESFGGIAVSPLDSMIFVLDTEQSRVHCFNFRGEYQYSWGEFGENPGQLNHPSDISASRSGEVLVADTQNQRVCVFQQDGKFLRLLTPRIKGVPENIFTFPSSIAVSREGVTAVADHDGRRIRIFTEFGLKLGTVEFKQTKGNIPEARVADMAFDSLGCLYVIDSVENRVLKIYPHMFGKVSKTPALPETGDQ